MNSFYLSLKSKGEKQKHLFGWSQSKLKPYFVNLRLKKKAFAFLQNVIEINAIFWADLSVNNDETNQNFSKKNF